MNRFNLFALLLVLTSFGLFAQEGNQKTMGVATNPVAALFEYGSAEVNFWQLDRYAEINIPMEIARDPFFFDEEDGVDFNYVATGINYRRFFNKRQQGLFGQAGWRFQRLSASGEGEKVTGTANSILFGIGYRIISENGFFWGTSFSVGRQWGELESLSGESVAGSGLTFDIDLLKFGFAW